VNIWPATWGRPNLLSRGQMQSDYSAANPTHIYMNKNRFRVVSHSTTGKSQRNIAESRGCTSWYTDVDNLGLHVRTM